MNRPPSIRRFEMLWWSSTAAWLVGTILAWERNERTLAANPQTAPAVGIAQPLTVAVILATTALVWWLAARRASVGGKWLVVVLAALSGLQIAVRLLGGFAHPLSASAFLLGSVLSILAAAVLFQPDAKAWFGGSGDEEA